MNSNKTNPSVESVILDSANMAKKEVQKSDDRFYIMLTTIGLIGLVSLLYLALA